MYVNRDLEEFKQYIRGRNVAVMGMGVSNTPLIKYLMDLDANITVFDKKTEEELGKAKCEEYAYKQVDRQMAQIKRLGIGADFDNKYITLQKEFEKDQIKVFKEMALNGFIYKGLKPVYWSPSR